MGSRIMHYCISNMLKQKLGIDDDQFFVGGLAPDVYSSNSVPKRRSHFVKFDDNGLEYSNYDSFYKNI